MPEPSVHDRVDVQPFSVIFKQGGLTTLRGVTRFYGARRYHKMRQTAAEQHIGDDECHLGVYLDVGDKVGKARTTVDSIKGFSKTSRIYSYEHDFVLTGRSHLLALGWGTNIGEKDMDQDDLFREQAAYAWSIPNLALVLVAVWMNPSASWWTWTRD